MESKIYYHSALLNRCPELAGEVLRWWRTMAPQDVDEGSSTPRINTKRRAELNRCGDPAQVMLTEGFRALLEKITDQLAEADVDYQLTDYDFEALACAAGLLARIRQSDQKSFASGLGNIENDKPVVSELRFQQLQTAISGDDFYRRMQRLLAQLGKTANVLSVFDDVLCWFAEHHSQQPRTSEKRLAVRWAIDYYRFIPAK